MNSKICSVLFHFFTKLVFDCYTDQRETKIYFNFNIKTYF